MSDDVSEVRKRIQEVQELPQGVCTRCYQRTGQIAPHYARLHLEAAEIVIWLPFCKACVARYLEEGAAQMPSRALGVTQQ